MPELGFLDLDLGTKEHRIDDGRTLTVGFTLSGRAAATVVNSPSWRLHGIAGDIYEFRSLYGYVGFQGGDVMVESPTPVFSEVDRWANNPTGFGHEGSSRQRFNAAPSRIRSARLSAPDLRTSAPDNFQDLLIDSSGLAPRPRVNSARGSIPEQVPSYTYFEAPAFAPSSPVGVLGAAADGPDAFPHPMRSRARSDGVTPATPVGGGYRLPLGREHLRNPLEQGDLPGTDPSLEESTGADGLRISLKSIWFELSEWKVRWNASKSRVRMLAQYSCLRVSRELVLVIDALGRSETMQEVIERVYVMTAKNDDTDKLHDWLVASRSGKSPASRTGKSPASAAVGGDSSPQSSLAPKETFNQQSAELIATVGDPTLNDGYYVESYTLDETSGPEPRGSIVSVISEVPQVEYTSAFATGLQRMENIGTFAVESEGVVKWIWNLKIDKLQFKFDELRETFVDFSVSGTVDGTYPLLLEPVNATLRVSADVFDPGSDQSYPFLEHV
jgi:hypothetical protein